MVNVTMFQAGKGDFFDLAYGEENDWHHILIDGGEKQASNQYRKTLQYIKNRNQSIDAIIFTHIDNDHITGALHAFVNMNKEELPDIHAVYFNTGNAICRIQELTKPEKPEDFPFVTKSTGQHSVKKAQSLLKVLDDKGLKKVLKDYIVQGEHINLLGGAELDMISPNTKELENFILKWDKEIEPADKKGKLHKGNSVSTRIYEENIEDYIKSSHPEDDSVTNRSSLAFIFRYKSVKIAFLGDACPSVCVEGIKKFSPEGIQVDLLTLAHHGSSANISDDLLEMIRTEKYLLSTTGEKLSKYLWARLVKGEKKAYVYCNYDWWKSIYCQKYFSQKDFETYIETERLTTHLVEHKGEKIRDGLWLYRSIQV
ncbi:MAG: MBL fold metallo-hydrolase [Lachnospiraceae bacterium]|nr:MBL fold metallo-hydrolase [Lachnospiraceae bacterium]